MSHMYAVPEAVSGHAGKFTSLRWLYMIGKGEISRWDEEDLGMSKTAAQMDKW